LKLELIGAVSPTIKDDLMSLKELAEKINESLSSSVKKEFHYDPTLDRITLEKNQLEKLRPENKEV
jgi:hypothetical protein